MAKASVSLWFPEVRGLHRDPRTAVAGAQGAPDQALIFPIAPTVARVQASGRLVSPTGPT